MTFSMSELNQPTKIEMEEEEEDLGPALSIKELEEQKKVEKEKQQKYDDIALVVCMITILFLTTATVVFKVMFIDEKIDPNVSTFRPLPQQINSNIKYTGNGYLPCNGYVPCQPVHLSPQELEERISGAGPCHDYQDKGDGPEGCW